ncbi:MAG: cysteine--tRNA ligase [Nanoarchaeota archaeon]|nr:cysteine--tRNA ligase [Nanoarchaeota archaeon]
MLKLYNTLTRKKEVFKPIEKGKAGIYSCGPTVYWYQHIGNLRSYLFSDSLRRILAYNGFKVKHVMNVTDVGHLTSDSDTGEDKMELAAKKEGKKAGEIANFYFEVFKKDIGKLNIISPWKFPKATEHIKEQIELVKKLERKKYTYETFDGIYFDSSKFKNYGKLAKLNLKGLKAGKRVSIRDKKNKTDFALWKFSAKPGEREQEWNSPWGIGFPGWHLECSAMSMKYLGNRFDIHTGGEDHIPIHHTNEIAQSEAVTGKKFVNYWLHGAFLMHKEKKVSKSKGGLYTISELEKLGYPALSFRYLCLLTNYRKSLNFSLENLDSAKNAYIRLKRRVADIRKQRHKGNDLTNQYSKMFLDAVNDDMNLSKAVDVLWKVVDDFDFEPRKKIKLLERFDEVLGLGVKDMKEEHVKVPAEVRKLIRAREQARRNKMWVEADILRQRVREKGFILEDTEEGVKVRKL